MPLRSVSMLSVWILSLTVLVTPRRESTISSIYVSTIPRSCPSTSDQYLSGLTADQLVWHPTLPPMFKCLVYVTTSLLEFPINNLWMSPSVTVKSDISHSTETSSNNTFTTKSMACNDPRPSNTNQTNSKQNKSFFQDQAQLANWSGHCNANRFTIFFVSFPVPFFVNVSSRPTWSQHLKKTKPTQKLSIAKFSYKILNPKAAEAEKDPMKVAQVILEASGLDTESYRLGNTKAWVPTDYLIFPYHKYLWSCDVCAPENVFLYIIFLCWPLFLDVTLCLVNRGKTSMIMTNPLVSPPPPITIQHRT